MSAHQIFCAHDQHAINGAYDGWYDDALGTVDLPDDADERQVARATGGYWCDGCAAYEREQEMSQGS